MVTTQSISRQRPGSACEECRRRKVRCDRRRPQCQVCFETGIDCKISTTRLPRGPRKGQLRTLRTRIGKSCLTSAKIDAHIGQLHLNVAWPISVRESISKWQGCLMVLELNVTLKKILIAIELHCLNKFPKYVPTISKDVGRHGPPILSLYHAD